MADTRCAAKQSCTRLVHVLMARSCASSSSGDSARNSSDAAPGSKSLGRRAAEEAEEEVGSSELGYTAAEEEEGRKEVDVPLDMAGERLMDSGDERGGEVAEAAYDE